MANEKQWEAIRLLIKQGRGATHRKEFHPIKASIFQCLTEIGDNLIPEHKKGLFGRKR